MQGESVASFSASVRGAGQQPDQPFVALPAPMHGAHGLTHKSTYVALLSMVELTRIISSERVLPLSLLFLLPSLTTFSISPLANDSQEMEKALVPLAEIDGAWAEKVIAQAKKTSVPRGHFVSSTALRRPSDGFLLIEDSVRISQAYIDQTWPPPLPPTGQALSPDLSNLMVVANGHKLELVPFALGHIGSPGSIGSEVLSSLTDHVLLGVETILTLYHAGELKKIIDLYLDSRRFFELADDTTVALDPIFANALRRICYNVVWSTKRAHGHRAFDVEFFNLMIGIFQVPDIPYARRRR